MLSPEEFPNSEELPRVPDFSSRDMPVELPEEDDQAELLDTLATEFLDRYRQGERPSVAEYAELYPELADDIRDLFPTIAQMEGLKIEIERPTETAPAAVAPRGKLKMSQLGDFRIIREIGRGGMGVVYEAEQTSLGRRVALKVLPLLSTLNPDLIRRFQREAKTAGRLHHSNIVPVFGVGESHGFHYYVMQMIDGIGLDTLIDEQSSTIAPQDTERTRRNPGDKPEPVSTPRPSQNGTLAESQSPRPEIVAEPTEVSTQQFGSDSHPGDTVDETAASPGSTKRTPEKLTRRKIIRIGIDAATALEYAHENGILHRDIKPGNLLLDRHGALWVADFGLAKAMETDDITASGNIVGTVRYMAPEALQGQADGRGDVYSLGVTLYEVLVGRRAWEQTDRTHLIQQIFNTGLVPLRKADPSIPRDLETVVMKATAREVKHRYQSAAEFARDLQNILEDRPILARRVTQAERLWRWSRRNPVVSSLMAISASLLLLVAVMASVRYEAVDLERERAEETSELALDALEKIFAQFAPDQATASSAISLGEGSTPAVVSVETATLLDELLKFYDKLADEADGDSELTLKSAQARRRVGDIRQRLGQYKLAIAAYAAADALYERLESEWPDRLTELQLARVGLTNETGLAQQMSGATEAARASHLSAIDFLDALPDAVGRQPEVRYELARSCCLLASRLQPGESPMSDLGETFSRQHRNGPEGPPRDRDFGPPRDDGFGPPRPGQTRGPNMPSQPMSDDDRDQFKRAIEILTDLHYEFPAVPRYRYLLAVCLRESHPERHPGEEIPGTLQPEQLLEELVDEFPDIAEYRHALAVTWSRVNPAELQTQSLEPVVMEDYLSKARDLVQGLIDDYPTVPTYTTTLIHIYGRLSHIQEQIGRGFAERDDRTSVFGEAERSLREAVELQESLVRRSPDMLAWRLWLARFEQRLARLLDRQYREKESREVLDAAIERLESYGESNDLQSGGHELLAMMFRDLADVCHRLGDAEGVINARLAADEHRDQLGDRRGPPPRIRPDF